MSDYALETMGLTKRYGRREAVRGLDLRVPRGTICGFLGPNGAGKSTTLRMIMGLVRPTAGAVRVFGHLVGRNGPPRAARVGALVEGPAFADYLSARANLEMLAALSGGVRAARLDQVLELVGLYERRHDLVRTFSHGMKQRLGLAQALLPAPRLVILDEPAQGLDPEGLAEMRRLLLHLRDQEQMTIFLSSHLLHEVEQTCDEVVVILQGECVVSGSVRDLLKHRTTPVRIEVDDLPRALAAAQAVVGEAARIAAERIELRVEREQLPTVNAALVAAGIRVYALSVAPPTLEQAYLEWMNHDDAPA